MSEQAAANRREEAIVKMDDAVRRSAIRKLDKAVQAVEHDKVALWTAAAECQRTQAYLADEEFRDSEASSSAMAEEYDPAGSRFARWVEHRYGYKRSHANQLSQAGRVYELLPENPPANERQMRPLYPLLKHEPDDPGIIERTWEAARESAETEHKPESVSRHITRLIEANGLKARKTLEEEERQLEADIKRFRKLFASLRERMDNPAFNKRVLGWIEGELK